MSSRERKIPVAEQIEMATETLGEENVSGPKEVKETFGVHLAEVPDIPFSLKELENAEQMRQRLVLRVDKATNGQPMSMEVMNEILGIKWKREGKGSLLRSVDGWKDWLGERFFTGACPRPGWALTSKYVLPESLGKNYLEQTEVIIQTLKGGSFKGLKLPEEYIEAIDEFEFKKGRSFQFMNNQLKKAAEEFAALKITQLTRQSISEAVYDLAIHHDHNNERLLADSCAWSSSLDHGGYLVCLGPFRTRGGVRGRGWEPCDRFADLGVSLSRRS